jgi:hypothetical protein
MSLELELVFLIYVGIFQFRMLEIKGLYPYEFGWLKILKIFIIKYI